MADTAISVSLFHFLHLQNYTPFTIQSHQRNQILLVRLHTGTVGVWDFTDDGATVLFILQRTKTIFLRKFRVWMKTWVLWDVTFRRWVYGSCSFCTFSLQGTLKADSYIACHALTEPVPRPCRSLIHTCHAAPLPCSDSVVSFVKVRMVAGNIRTASPTV